MYALADILNNAKETIQIADWWLSPELFLIRPPQDSEEVSALKVVPK